MQAPPIAKDLVLVGGGHSHVIALRMLGMKPVPGLQITLLSPDTRTPYSGMLPGFVAGHYDEQDIHIDLVPLCRFAGARFIQCAVDGIDPLMQTVSTEGRPALRYDVLSIDIGISPELDAVPGARGNVIPVKPINEFLLHWRDFVARVARGEVTTVGFVGAGAGGVELCLAVQHRLAKEFAPHTHPLQWHLFADGSDILVDYPATVRERFKRIMAERGISIHQGWRVSRVDGDTLVSDAGDQARLDEIFWVTSAAAQPWLQNSGLKLNDKGFICTRNTLQTDSHSNVFAVGDTAHMMAHPRPKAGVYAVRQGMPLVRNITRFLLQQPLKDFVPQRDFLSLISTGDQHAVASRNGRSIEGAWVWRWKDWIDQRFMRRFSALPAMPSEKKAGLLADFDEQMQCGGCGSKVSGELLSEVLDSLGSASLDSAMRDDAASYQVPPGKTMLHSIDYFKTFIDDPYQFARVAVTHALGDIYAMGGQPVTALALVTVPHGKPAVVRSILQQLLAGAKRQLDEDGVALVGGHTTEGVELSIGFSVNGIVDERLTLRKSGMAEGQAIVLTKSLGTGTLFAADMQHKAQGNWITSALASMMQSNQQALQVLRKYGVTACTDVTGFGLAGHLFEMMTASKCGVSLDLSKLPVLPGSQTTIHDLAIKSTLHEANRQSAFDVPESRHQNFELLFDPQTSGGLLASIPASQADACVQGLREAGYAEACCIGKVGGGFSLTLEAVD
jgi:selenide, water dikinase